MKYLITGATGFLGQHLAQYLKTAGHEVTVLGRNKLKIEQLAAQGFSAHSCDLDNKDELIMLTKGMDCVIHCAALSDAWGKYQTFYDTNFVGTKNIQEACLANNIDKLIFTSTPSVYVASFDRLGIKETDPFGNEYINHYAETKKMAEKYLQENIGQKQTIFILRPQGIIGAGDTAIRPRIKKLFDKGYFILIKNKKTYIDLTYVDNVVHAISLCLDAKSNLSCNSYNISNGQPVECEEQFKILIQGLGIECRPKQMSAKFLLRLAEVLDRGYSFLKISKEPLITRYSARTLVFSRTLDISKAQNELGYKPKVDIHEGLKRYIHWWKAENKKEEGL